VSADDPDRTRLAALRNVKAIIGQDIEQQVREMVEQGWPPDSAFISTAGWWHQNVAEASWDARKALGIS
jgi:ribulose bisphosphate carboxylase small subunit